MKEKGAAMQAPGSKAIGKCTCKGNPSQRPSTPTEEETSPGGVMGPAEKHDRMMIGWQYHTQGHPGAKMSTRLLRDQRKCFTRMTWVVFVKLEGWVRLRVVFKATLTPMQKGVCVWVGGWLLYTHRLSR